MYSAQTAYKDWIKSHPTRKVTIDYESKPTGKYSVMMEPENLWTVASNIVSDVNFCVKYTK